MSGGGARVVELSEPLSSSLIFDWIQDPRVTGLSSLAKSWARFGTTVQLFGGVFSEGGVSETPILPDDHYSYYYSDGSEMTSGSAYLECGSHEWMATALCVFAICKKYSVKTYKPSPEMEEYLRVIPLEDQEIRCLEGLEYSQNGNGNISADHFLAYQWILEGIIKKGEVWRNGADDTDGFKAVLYFVQGMIAFLMDSSRKRGIPNQTLNCLKAAREKEPDSYVWSYISFLMTRAYRRKLDFAELLGYSRKADELAPRQMKVRTGSCLIWAEIEDAKAKGLSSWREETWDLIRSVKSYRNSYADPSPLHNAWAVRKLREFGIETGSVPRNFLRDAEEETVSTADVLDKRWKIVSASQLECPTLWVANYLDQLPKYTVKKFHNNSVPDYLIRRLSQREFSLPELPEPVESYEALVDVGLEDWMCTKLCVGSIALLLNLEGSRWNTLGNCKSALWNNPEEISESHQQAYRYLLRASDVCEDLIQLKTNVRNITMKETKRMNRSISKMMEKWESVEDSAVVHFVRGRMAAIMGLSHDVSLKHFRKAATLEPDNALWQQLLYETLKRIRGSGVEHSQRLPRSEELAACHKALKLSPGNVKIMVDLVTVKLQSLNAKSNDQKIEQTIAKDVDSIEKLLKKALTLAPTNSRDEMMALLKTGELYTSKGLPQRTSEAKEIFMECYKKWPKSSMVLHKVAKFHHYNDKDFSQAENIYAEAMHVAPGNFPCLMDFLKLYGRLLKKYEDMIKIIDRCFSFIKESGQLVQLLIIKGQALWVLDQNTRMEACNVWVEALKDFDWLGAKVKHALLSPSSLEFRKLHISRSELYPLLMEACENQDLDISNNKYANELIADLQKPEERKTRRRRRQSEDSGGEASSVGKKPRFMRCTNEAEIYERFKKSLRIKIK